MSKKKAKEFIEYIKDFDNIYIQTHDFPDPDSIFSAYGLREILSHFGIKSTICYSGVIQRDILKYLLNEIKAEIYKVDELDINTESNIIIVDGRKGNRNVANLVGRVIATIDHHQGDVVTKDAFLDIRPDYGSTSTIIYEYYEELGIEINKKVATALLVGLYIDTFNMRRDVSDADLRAFYSLYSMADKQLLSFVLWNNLELSDIQLFNEAINNYTVKENCAFVYLKSGCPSNTLGIICDFFIQIIEINFVVCIANNEYGLNLSVRSELPKLDAQYIIKSVLEGIGFGGGHKSMAGGFVPKSNIRNVKETVKEIFNRFEININRAINSNSK